MLRNVGLLTYQLPGTGGVSRARSAARVAQILSHPFCERVRATQHAPRDPFSVLESRHGLVEIVEHASVGFAERPRVDAELRRSAVRGAGASMVLDDPATILRLAESEGACDAFYEAVVVRRVEAEGVYHDRVRRGCNLCAALRGEACRVEGVN